MILPEVAARIERQFHEERCVCEGTFDKRCKAMDPVEVSGIGWEMVSEVSTGAIATNREAVTGAHPDGR